MDKMADARDPLLSSLNKAQWQAVRSAASTVAILAGPGSGKTHTLTSRVVWLVDRVGYDARNILVATFTVKAAREMKERIGNALGGGRERQIVLGTFHSIARRYLAAYGQLIGLDRGFGIADDADSRGIMSRICKRLDIKIDVPIARAFISKRKAKGTSADGSTGGRKPGRPAVESRALETCYTEYQNQLERSNLLDYDDLLVRCVELLRRFPRCVSNIEAVLIDEFQDTNAVQSDLMRLFAQRKQKITIVGDPDQSIYGWRSAEIQNLRRFLRTFPETDQIALEENYRSSSSILDLSLKVIQQDADRYQKALLPVHDKGARPVLRKLKRPMDEADWIVSEIKRVKMMSGEMMGFDDVAILLRSASLSRHVESALGRSGIAYRMVGGFKFYDRKEIKTILDYLRIINQPDNNDALARIINVPKRGIGEATIKSLVEEAETASMSLWDLLTKHCRGDRKAKTTIRKQTEQKISGELLKVVQAHHRSLHLQPGGIPVNLVDLIQRLVRELNFERHLKDEHGDQHESRWANVQELIGLAGEFMRDQILEEEEASLPDIDGLQQAQEKDVLGRFLANVSLASDKQSDQQAEARPHVTVSTIHAAKGLEWAVVFIPGVYNGSIPHMRSDDEAEERRLLYVAMTRAQALLYLSYPLYSVHGAGEQLQLSPFIQAISTGHFLQRGPSFDRRILTEMAKILRRHLPTEEAIYKHIPPMTALEDDLFPLDPAEAKIAGLGPSSLTQGYKRRKSYHTSSTSTVVPESVEGWNAPYATTMQRSSSFTLPSFTTAGARHTADVADVRPTMTGPAPAPPRRAGPSNGPPTQRTLRGFVVNDHDMSRPARKHSALTARAPASRPGSGRPSAAGPAVVAHAVAVTPAPTATGIAPALADHRPGPARIATKPAPARRVDDAAPPKPCHFLSSSPTRPVSAEWEVAPVPDPVPDPARPAVCFHATTVRAGARGFGKPTGPTRDGIAPVDRLRKPFRPLTINRQGSGR